MIAKFIAFALVGVVGTLAHYLTLYLLVESYAFSPVKGSGCGALVGLVVNYLLNYALTFKSQQSHQKTFPKFALIAGIGFSLNQGLMAILTPQIYYLYAQLITTALVLVWNFLGNSLWTFQMDNQQPSQPNPTKFSSAFTLLFFVIALRFITLGLYPLYDPSESRYAEMGRKMWEIGNWVTPMIEYGVPFWGKPPLTIWLEAASLGIFGINDFAARLPSFLVSLGVCGIVFHLAKTQQNRDCAWNAVIILASSVLFFVMAGTVAMDVCLNFGITLALASFWLALKEQKNAPWGYLFFVGLSFGIMAKGPLALVLSGFSLGLWTLISGEWQKVWQRIPWIKGTLLMLCLSVPWFIIAEQRTPGFLEYFIIGEHWKRFTEKGWTGDLYGSGRAKPHGMIWVYWLAATFPWCLIFLKRHLGAILNHSLISSYKGDNWRLYCLLWMLSPLLFFTVAANIIWTYALPALPAFALLLANDVKTAMVRTVLATCVPIGFFALVLAYHFSDVYFFRSQQRIVTAYYQLSYQSPAKKVTEDAERLFYVGERPLSAQFYAQGNALKITPDAFMKNLSESHTDFYVIPQNGVNQLSETAKRQLIEVQHYGDYYLFHHILPPLK